MKIQLALDRLTISQAIHLTQLVRDSVDWIEVGTSLIKEFGQLAIKEMKVAFPDKVIVADAKTIDNAKYEFEMCFQSGADVATVMGVAPLVTIDTCMNVAVRMGKQVMVDLLNTTKQQQSELFSLYKDAIFCDHVSKDEQETKGQRNNKSLLDYSGLRIAVAGGIALESLPKLKAQCPEVIIVGSAITKAADPMMVASQFKQILS